MPRLREDQQANGCRPGVAGLLAGLLFSPGLLAVALYRASAALYPRGPLGRLAAKLLWRWNVSANGCYLSPKARIGAGLHLPHPVAVVVGDGVVLGDRVTLYQGVTVGARGPGDKVYPAIGDGAVLYAGAVVAGGVRVGAHAVVGAQSLVIADVPAHATAVGSPARILGTGGVREARGGA